MMNIREPFLRESHLLPFTVVHGHVPSPSGPVVAPGRIGIDTGAYASGVLTAVALRATGGHLVFSKHSGSRRVQSVEPECLSGE